MENTKENRWIVICVSLVWLIIVTFLFQFVFDDPLFIGTAILGLVGSVITFIVEAHSKIGQKIAHIRDRGETISSGIVKVGMAIIQTVKEASLLHLILLLCGTTILGEFLGSVGLIERTRRFVSAGYAAVTSEAEYALAEVEVDEETLAVILSECDETTIKMLQQADITPAELDAAKKLSQEDSDLVFYLKQKDIDWTDQNAVNAAVLLLIDEIRAIQMENVFDKNVNNGGAPQQLRDSVYQASEDEKKCG